MVDFPVPAIPDSQNIYFLSSLSFIHVRIWRRRSTRVSGRHWGSFSLRFGVDCCINDIRQLGKIPIVVASSAVMLASVMFTFMRCSLRRTYNCRYLQPGSQNYPMPEDL